MKRQKKVRRRFVMRAKFAIGELVRHRNTPAILSVIDVQVARPGYILSDGRFFAEDEIEPVRSGKVGA